jgi:excisionase family DNA binding protein
MVNLHKEGTVVTSKALVEDPLISISVAAKQFGMSERGVRNWIQRGMIPYVKLMGHSVRISQSTVDKIIADGRDRSNDMKLPQAARLSAAGRKGKKVA